MWNGNLFLVDAIHRGRESRAKKKRLRTKKNRILRARNNTSNCLKGFDITLLFVQIHISNHVDTSQFIFSDGDMKVV